MRAEEDRTKIPALTMYTRDEISTLVEEYISSLSYPGEPQRLYAPIAYSLEGGGKRLRPGIVLMAYNIFDDRVERALPCAAAIEMFHNFTLLHDDIMDNADIRRGKSTVHRRWDQNIAILSGDAMVICAYQLLQQAPAGLLPQLLAEFNKMAIEVCEGQQFDIDFEQRDEVLLDEYMNMIRLKTAVMIAASAKIGAMTAGAPAADADALYSYGLEVGLAYQLQDDYLDTYGTAETLGKNIGGDIAESKKTFLTINALHEAGEATRRAILATFRDSSHSLEQKINRIRTIYTSLDIPNITLTAIEEHLRKAEQALDRLAVGEQRRAPLRELLATLRNRNK